MDAQFSERLTTFTFKLRQNNFSGEQARDCFWSIKRYYSFRQYYIASGTEIFHALIGAGRFGEKCVVSLWYGGRSKNEPHRLSEERFLSVTFAEDTCSKLEVLALVNQLNGSLLEVHPSTETSPKWLEDELNEMFSWILYPKLRFWLRDDRD